MKSRHVTNLIIVMLILLIPIMALDIFATKPKIIMTSMDMVKAGDKEAAAGNYEEALKLYNKAEERFNEISSGSLLYEDMAKTERKKAAVFKAQGNNAAANDAIAKALHQEDLAAKEPAGDMGCLIATATFDSPLSPQVQQLREFRQGNIYSTASGTQFMTAFNAWYYSFSPVVANFIDDHPSTKPPMRIILTPLMGILTLAKMSFTALTDHPDIAVIVTGLVASTLIGIIYAFPVLLVLLLVIRKVSPFSFTTGVFKILGVSAIAGLYLLVVAELMDIKPVLLFGSVLFIVSLVFLTGLFLSWVCINRLDLRSAHANTG